MSWEFDNDRDMYSKLVGNFFGTDPESTKRQIKHSREQMASEISRHLNLSKERSAVLEIGSGTGEMASTIASMVKNLICVDVSSSFLEKARATCKNHKNISFSKIESGNLGFLQEASIDAVYSHAVFIHFNIYDFYIYFKSLSRILKEKGRVCIDFLSTDSMNFHESELFQEHLDYYTHDKNSFPGLLNFHSEQTIINIALENGLFPLFKYRSYNNAVLLVLEKRPVWSGRHVLPQMFYALNEKLHHLKSILFGKQWK